MNTTHDQNPTTNRAIPYPLLQTTSSPTYLNQTERSLGASPHLFDNNDPVNSNLQSKWKTIQQFFTSRRLYLYEQSRSRFTKPYLRNNLARIIFLIIYVLTNIALTLYVVIYRAVVVKANALIVFARIGAMLLNFNCTMVLVLMLKYTIFLTRSNSFLRKWIPADDHIDFHKFVGRFITILALLHTIAHLINFGLRSEHSWSEFVFTTYPDIGWVGGFTPLSGVILCIILAIMVIFSMKWIRRGGHFQVFYWTHLLYLIFYILLIIHARPFWKWVVVPLSLFVLEKIYSNVARYSSKNGRTRLLSVTIEPSDVICLYIYRPKYFRFKAGDYISLNIPSIALYEYHPFTISSAPEMMSYMTVHVQAVGDWTKRVYQRYKDISDHRCVDNDLIIHRADLNIAKAAAEEREQLERIHREEEDQEEYHHGDENERIIPESRERSEMIIIKGPYSSSARYIFDSKHVVLIGGGIGITPYASILQSLMAQFRASRIICKHCQGLNYDRRCIIENKYLKKVDFIWVNRNYRNFEWFLNTLHEFECEQDSYLKLNMHDQRFLDTHLYFTGLKSNEETPTDNIFTAIKSKIQIGRPIWSQLFQSLKTGENLSMANDVSVFFCGPPSMGKAIHQHCIDHRFKFFEEKF